MSSKGGMPDGLTRGGAVRLEFAIIGLGVLALILIFQPFSLMLFGIGSGLVVLAGLVNNLLPLAQPGVKGRMIVFSGLIVAMIFCLVVLIAIAAAHLYGVLFLTPVAATPAASAPFYLQPFVWWLGGVAVVLIALVVAMARSGDGGQ